MIAFDKLPMWVISLSADGYHPQTLHVAARDYESAVTIARGVLVDRFGDDWMRPTVNLVSRSQNEIYFQCVGCGC